MKIKSHTKSPNKKLIRVHSHEYSKYGYYAHECDDLNNFNGKGSNHNSNNFIVFTASIDSTNYSCEYSENTDIDDEAYKSNDMKIFKTHNVNLHWCS